MAWGRYFIRIILFRPHFSSEKNVNVAHCLCFLMSDSSEIWTQRRESTGGGVGLETPRAEHVMLSLRQGDLRGPP